MSGNRIVAGTSKGLVTAEKGEAGNWEISGVQFTGLPVSMFFEDKKTHRLWAAIAHRHWGTKLHFSDDGGNDWQLADTPVFPAGLPLPESRGKQASLRKIWCMNRSTDGERELLWLGVEPGALFVSEDNGQSFELVGGLWDHPSRQNATQWFGAGRDHSFVHSIVVDPEDESHLYIAVSCAGVFESRDSGVSWQPRNSGLIATYLPNPHTDVGHDPHLLLACASNPSVMWQQNHCGVFRSTDGGMSWEDKSDRDRLVDYGFALAIDNRDCNRAWVIPAISDEQRVAAGLSLCVCKTEDGGQTWQEQRKGLPQSFCFDIVFRHSFVRNNEVMAFGTSTGNMFVSENDGESWERVTSHLARVENIAILKH